jgi:hypothetical protein
MNTIIVIYTNTKVEAKNIGNTKKYCFNTEADLKEGDMIVSPAYSTPIQVVAVIKDTDYQFYNQTTGDLSNKLVSTNQWKIKKLIVVEALETDAAIYGSIIPPKA